MAKRPTPKLNAGELWEYALSTLSRRALSTDELRQRLARRAENTADIPDILHRLQDSRYLDDSRFAESFAQSRLDSQGHGRQRVLRDLRTRRVAPPVAEQVVKTIYDGTDEVTLIEEYLARKYRNRSLPALLQDPLQLASAYRKLRYAGFSSSTSIRVLKRYSAQADELESCEEGEEA
jgi:regulatory protein